MTKLGTYMRVIWITLESHAYFDGFNFYQGWTAGEVWHCQ